MELRPYQSQAIRDIYSGIKAGHTKQVLQMATGAGKTVTAGTIIGHSLSRDKKALFIVDGLDLLEQSIDVFDGMGFDVGAWQGINVRNDISADVVVATIQTLAARDKKNPEGFQRWINSFGVVFIDEVHVHFKQHERIGAEITVPLIGLSATPWKKGLANHFDNLVIGATTGELIEQGFLSEYVAYGVSMPDLKGVKTQAGDYKASDVAERYTPELTADIVQTWLKHGRDRKTVVFAATVAQSKYLAAQFQAAGVSAAHVDGYGGDAEKEVRAQTIQDFRDSKIQVICNVMVLVKGVDIPDISCIVFAIATKSEMKFIQALGRGLRIHPGKENCMVLDHGGNVGRLGFPEDIHHEELLDGITKEKDSKKAKEKEEKLPTPCSACGYLSTEYKCPQCGFAPVRTEAPETAEGELIQLDKERRKRNKDMTPNEKRKFYGELKGYCKLHGHKPGYAAWIYKEKTGVWPNKYSDSPELPPDAATLAYIKHLHIKRSKGKGTA